MGGEGRLEGEEVLVVFRLETGVDALQLVYAAPGAVLHAQCRKYRHHAARHGDGVSYHPLLPLIECPQILGS